MSSATPQDTATASTPATGTSRRLLGWRIALGAGGAAVVGVSMFAGWFLQVELQRAAPQVSEHSTANAETTLAESPQPEQPHQAAAGADTSLAANNRPVAVDAHHAAERLNGSEHSPTGDDQSHVAAADAPEQASSGHAVDHTAGESATGAADSPQTAHAGQSPANEVAPSAEELALADAAGEQKLLEGDASAALRVFDWVAKHQDRSLDDRFHYRCGVCAESLGEFNRALAEYGAALTSASDETLIVLSRLGQARVWRALGHSDMATQLLATAFLTNGNERRAAVVRPYVAYLLADALAAESVAAKPPMLTEDDGVVFPMWKFDLFERALLRSFRTQETQSVPIDSGVRVLPGNVDADPVVQANLPRMGVRNTVDALCRAAQRPTDWTVEARQAVTGRSAQVCVSHAGLALCLDGLTAPLGVVWSEQGGEIHLAVVDELDPETVRLHRQAATSRALMHAVQQYPDFVLAPHARITLGNLAFQDGRFDEAQGHYEQAFTTDPHSAVRPDAWFNLAKLHLRCERVEPALESFWHVIDSGAAPETAAVASLYIGRLLLDAEQPRRAIMPLTRATQWTTSRSVRARSVLSLAAAYLLYGNPTAANEVLMDFRSDVDTQSQQAAFLSAVARYRAAENPTRRLYEGQELLTAADPVQPGDFFGRYGWYLCGQVYEELMLPEMAADVYREAVSASRRLPYHDAIVFGLASCLADSGDGAGSQQHFSDVLQHAAPEWQRKAAFRLSRLQLDMDQPLEASRTARKLLELSPETGDKARALRLLGEAYQRLGDHAAAALCFAGSTPGETPAADAGEQ